MDIEKLKKEFIKLKSGELEYLDNIAKLGYQKTFSQEEKLNIYRKLKFYENENARFYKLLSNILQYTIFLQKDRTIAYATVLSFINHK